MSNQMRQGDLLFERIPSLPCQLSKVTSGILAYGEVTGHTHRVADLSKCDVFVDQDGNMFIQTKENTAIVHEEHDQINLSTGDIFSVTRQRKYDPIAEERERKIAD